MVIHPQYLYKSELQSLGISEALLYKASTIVCYALGEDWITTCEKHQARLTGLARLFNKHPIFALLTDPLVEKSILLVLLATVLNDIPDSVEDHLPRLRKAELSLQALYELFTAKLFVSAGFTLIGLEVESMPNKPMDVVIEKGGTRYYVECNSSEQRLFTPSEADVIMARIMPVFKKLPQHTAVYIKQKYYYLSPTKVKQVIGELVRQLTSVSIPHQMENDDFALSVFRLPDGSDLTMQEFYRMVDFMMAESIGPAVDGKPMEDAMYTKERERVLGMKSPEELQLNVRTRIYKALLKRIKAKVAQHKELLGQAKELVLMIDSEDMEKDDIAGAIQYMKDHSYLSRYPTLSILIMSYASTTNRSLSTAGKLFTTLPLVISVGFRPHLHDLLECHIPILK